MRFNEGGGSLKFRGLTGSHYLRVNNKFDLKKNSSGKRRL